MKPRAGAADMLKRYIAALLLVLMFTLTACSPKGNGDSDRGDTDGGVSDKDGNEKDNSGIDLPYDEF